MNEPVLPLYCLLPPPKLAPRPSETVPFFLVVRPEMVYYGSESSNMCQLPRFFRTVRYGLWEASCTIFLCFILFSGTFRVVHELNFPFGINF